MPDIKLRDGSGVEQTYEGVDTITVPLADGTGYTTYGLTDDDLTVENHAYYLLASDFSNKTLKNVLDRITFKCTNSNRILSGTIYDNSKNNLINDLSKITINCETGDIKNICIKFASIGYLNKLPIIIGDNLFCGSNFAIDGNYYNLTEDEFYKFLSHFSKYTCKNEYGDTSSIKLQIFSTNPTSWEDCSNVNLKWHEIINNSESKHYSSSTNVYGFSLYGGCFKNIKNIPLIKLSTKVTNNVSNIWSSINSNYALKGLSSLTFATEDDGTAIAQNWRTQTIDFANSYTVGYYPSSYNGVFDSYTPHWSTEGTNIFTSDSMTIDEATERYNAVKSLDWWYSQASNKVTYDGNSVYIALLFSRYNHDSAVETINSLPDCSAYLATAGGTNTIKFKKYSGALTDGGGVETLTDEEIAVATAKGWTVTFVS